MRLLSALSSLGEFRGARRESCSDLVGDGVSVVGGAVGLLEKVAQRALLLGGLLENGRGDMDWGVGNQCECQRVARARVDNGAVGEDRLCVECGVSQLDDAHFP